MFIELERNEVGGKKWCNVSFQVNIKNVKSHVQYVIIEKSANR